MAERLLVVIQKHPENLLRCFTNRFAARPGSTVRFLFPGEPHAEIQFPGDTELDTPFAAPRFKFSEAAGAPGSGVVEMQVRLNAPPRSYGYTVTWGNAGGLGNGGGEVLHSR